LTKRQSMLVKLRLHSLIQAASCRLRASKYLPLAWLNMGLASSIHRGLGFSPTQPRCVRLRLPAMTEEGRKELVKKVKATVEEAKVGLRNIRRDCTDKVKKAEKQKEIGENESRRQLELVQK